MRDYEKEFEKETGNNCRYKYENTDGSYSDVEYSDEFVEWLKSQLHARGGELDKAVEEIKNQVDKNNKYHENEIKLISEIERLKAERDKVIKILEKELADPALDDWDKGFNFCAKSVLDQFKPKIDINKET